MSRRLKSIPLAALMLVAMGGAPAWSQPANIVVPEPEIEEPSAYIERKLAAFREKLAELKKAEAEGEQLFDPNATAESVVKSLRALKPKNLTITANSTKTFKLPDPFDRKGGTFLLRQNRISLNTAFGKFSGLRLAVNAETAAALNLEQKVSTEWIADVVRLIPRGTCCTDKRRDVRTGREICENEVPVFTEERQTIDLRSLLNRGPISPEVEYERLSGDPGGTEVRASEIGQGIMTVRMGGLYQPIRVQCGTIFDARRNISVPRNVIVGSSANDEKAVLEYRIDNVKLVAFGVPGIHVQNGRSAPVLDHFTEANPQHRAVDIEDGSVGDFPQPVIQYQEVAGEDQFNGIEQFNPNITVSTSGIGAFLPGRKGKLQQVAGDVPGASVVTWSLNDVVEASVTLSMNAVSVELPDIGRENRVLVGREYDAVVHIDGPVDITKGGYEFSWLGNVNWASDDPVIEKKDGGTTITNRFRVEAGVEPSLRIDMHRNAQLAVGGNTEIFTFGEILNVVGSTVGSLELRARIGESFAVIDAPRQDQIDTFFPSTAPASPVTVSASTSFIDSDGGKVVVAKALSSAGLVGIQPPDRLMASSNSDFLKRTRFALAGASHFQVKPVIGAANIVSELSGHPEAAKRLSSGATDSFVAQPIVVTSNVLQLIRKKNGFELKVRGPADMTQYQARWTPRDAPIRTTGFNVRNGGPQAEIETSSRLRKVEIIRSGQVVATMPGIMATVPAQIEILPFRQAAKVVNKGKLGSGGEPDRLEFETSCRESTEFNILANGQELRPGQSVRDFCADEFKRELDQAQAELKAGNDAQKVRNKFLKQLEKNGKSLVELSNQMEVAAVVRGAPSEHLGETVCVWSIVGGQGPLRMAQRVTSLRREGAGDFCFNVVDGVSDGFTPGAEIKVELKLLDKGRTAQVIRSGVN